MNQKQTLALVRKAWKGQDLKALAAVDYVTLVSPEKGGGL